LAVKQARIEFIASAFSPRDFPRTGIPEVVIAGRSNVGKSSLINRLMGVKGLARTSATPGKTRSINFYRCDGAFFLVDLPGFGFAKGKAEAREWKKLIEEYFKRGSNVALVIHLVDARMPPTNLDIQLAEWLVHLSIPRLVVATKSDKISGNQRAVEKRAIALAFPEVPVIFSSSVTGVGCKEIWNRVADATQDH
jgi:GTP-binding protein